MSDLEDRLLLLIRNAGLPEPEREYRWHQERKWRFDFAFPAYMIAVEVEGGKWMQGRHQRPQGFEDDCEKYSAAAVFDWRVIRVTGDMIDDGRAMELLLAAFQFEEER